MGMGRDLGMDRMPKTKQGTTITMVMGMEVKNPHKSFTGHTVKITNTPTAAADKSATMNASLKKDGDP